MKDSSETVASSDPMTYVGLNERRAVKRNVSPFGPSEATEAEHGLRHRIRVAKAIAADYEANTGDKYSQQDDRFVITVLEEAAARIDALEARVVEAEGAAATAELEVERLKARLPGEIIYGDLEADDANE